MPQFCIRNWHKYQHYKDRRPPWIKLYRDLLDNPDWFALRDRDARILVNIWLIASESNSGILPDTNTLAFRLRISVTHVDDSLKRLVECGFVADASTALADCYQDAIPETERERETEGEEKKEIEAEKINEPLFSDFVLQVFHLYATICPSLPQLRDPQHTEIGKKIATQIKARTKGNNLDIDDWRQLFTYINQTPFLNGQNDKNWQASLDWIVGPENFGKLMTRKYGGPKQRPAVDDAERQRLLTVPFDQLTRDQRIAIGGSFAPGSGWRMPADYRGEM